MNQIPKVVPITELITATRTLRDYSYYQERLWWLGMLVVSVPLILLTVIQKSLAEFNIGNSYLPWWAIVVIALFLLSARIGIVWSFQRQRKHYEERMRFHQTKIDQGYVYVTVEDGKQKFLRK